MLIRHMKRAAILGRFTEKGFERVKPFGCTVAKPLSILFANQMSRSSASIVDVMMALLVSLSRLSLHPGTLK